MKDNFKTHAAPLFMTPALALAAFPTAHFLIKIRESWAEINHGKAYQPVPCDEREIKFCQLLVDKGMASWCNRNGTLSEQPVHLRLTCPNIYHQGVSDEI